MSYEPEDDILTVDHLPPDVQKHSLVAVMVAGANARARRVAPCLYEPGKDAPRAEALLILVGAVQRWSEAGAGALSQVQAGPFQMSTDNRSRTGFNLWPTEIENLQDLCKVDTSGAFAIDTAPDVGRPSHALTCSIYFGSTCSCGANLTGDRPLWGFP